MAQIPVTMDTWEVPKDGTAVANDTVTETISLIDDILRNRNLLGKPVSFRKLICQATAQLDGELFIAGVGKAFHCYSPNFTDVIVYDTPKPFKNDLVVQLTETLGATPLYVLHVSGFRSMI